MKKAIETIFTHEIGGDVKGVLGIDKDARLYWNGQPVLTEQKVTLQWWVNVFVIVASLSTLAMAIFTGLQYFKLK